MSTITFMAKRATGATLLARLKADVEAFRAAKARVLGDKHLSQEGKSAKMAELWPKGDATITASGSALWGHIEEMYRDTQRSQALARAAADAQWDYGRLGYHASTVGGLLAGVRNADEARKVWEAIKSTGTREQRRAFAEVAPGILGGLSGDVAVRAGLEGLRGDLRRDLAELLNTDDLKAVNAQGSILVGDIEAANHATREALTELQIRPRDFFDNKPTHPLGAWLERIEITDSRRPATGEYVRTITFGAAPGAAA